MASRALSARLMSAVESWPGSTSAGQASSSNTDSISTCSPKVGRSSFAASTISVLTSVVRGCSGWRRVAAGEGEAALGQLGPANGGLVDHAGDLDEARIAGDALLQDLDRAGDHSEDIVEVVGDAAGELADRLHLLRLAQLLVGGEVLGDVAHETVEQPAAAPAQRRHRQLDLDLLAVAPQRLDHEPLAEDLALAGGKELREPLAVARAMRRRHDQIAELLADCLLERPAEDRRGLQIPVDDDAVLVHLGETIERGVDDPARP